MIDQVSKAIEANGVWKAITARPAQVAILIALVGQAILSAKFQITNNAEQAAQIKALELSLTEYKQQADRLQTTAGTRIIRLEDRVDAIIAARGPIFDRLQLQLDRLSELELLLEKRLHELEFKMQQQK